jgi:hypothetical protein
MEEKLTKLYNTMLTIETKGANTKTMADCLRFLENVIVETRNAKIDSDTEEVEP